jgi:carboxymethylenebutenolidase
MPEREIRLDTPSGPMRCFIAQPEGDGVGGVRFPSGVIFMDAPGYREALFDVARRYAAHGYLVAAPDMYAPFGENIEIDINRVREDRAAGRDSEEGRRMFGYVRGLTAEVGEGLAGAVLEQLDAEAAADDGPRVCLGFCMGSRHVIHTLAAFNDRVVAGAGIHPGKLVSDDEGSPHRDLADITGELHLGFAERDEASSDEQLAALRAEGALHDVRMTIEVYPDTDHGFAMNDARVYSEAGAERHYERTLELWGRATGAVV